MNVWEAVLTQSKVNDRYYDEERLPQQRWEWPRGTWFQSRLDLIREHEAPHSLRSSSKMKVAHELRAM
jgi:hypothetical protein